jgi:hypothetical protein
VRRCTSDKRAGTPLNAGGAFDADVVEIKLAYLRISLPLPQQPTTNNSLRKFISCLSHQNTVRISSSALHAPSHSAFWNLRRVQKELAVCRGAHHTPLNSNLPACKLPHRCFQSFMYWLKRPDHTCTKSHFRIYPLLCFSYMFARENCTQDN